ncbi:ABC transporter permease [Leucobacter massiliensis]|uniref:Uncharacterized protein n=1 Tax=Leucobacter massiliensis TaxID=1686285 RepID=A0A2S9QR48_9MICO|nr:ABC transporter permease [Leucobacter massiliensis]PRI12059.1 hypothetical protein B4915_03070 [Leucobacter massiliensis]
MYWTMLRRELLGRKRQTVIVAVGLAVAIALVIVVSALSTGVRQAQTEALQGVYGVGTDLTVTGTPAQPEDGGGPRFDFGSGDGTTGDDGTRTLATSRLMTDPRQGTLAADTVTTVAALDGVEAATGALSLTNTTFTGQLPDTSQLQAPGQGGQGGPPAGGPDGAGGSSFGVDSFTVLGVDPAASDVGPLSATTVTDGRALDASDAGQLVAVVDSRYAESAELAVGDTLSVGGSDTEIVGIVSSTSDEAETAANVYLPIDTARTLAGADDVVSTVYVSASSAAGIDAVQQEIEDALPDATVSSQADLAAQVSGSLSSASSLITNLGLWLSIIVLAVALAIAMLLTSSGVARRTREFGTLKAIGWSNGRVVGQLAGESGVQALLGGVAGLILGLGAVAIVNLIGPTIGGGTPAAAGGGAGGAPTGAGGPGGIEGGPGGIGGAAGRLGTTVSEITLHAPVTLWVVALALALALLGGLLAGGFGAWRAARLSPAEALRSVA